MSTLARMVVKLQLDSQGFAKGVGQIEKDAENAAKKINKSLIKIGDGLQNIGNRMTTFITLPLVAGFGLATKAASDLNETMNKTQVIFGDSTNDILKFFQNSSTAMGMSKNQALDAASAFGGLFKSMKVGSQDTVNMSENLVQLAADLGSFYNLKTDDVLQKLQSGMVGQTEPLRSLNIVLSAAAVQAKAAEMGLIGVNGVMSDAAAVTARYQLIMEKTSLVQGDYGRTADSLANLTKSTIAELNDALADLGKNLLPIALNLVTMANNAITAFNALDDGAKKSIVNIGLVLAALGPLISGLGTVIGMIGNIRTLIAGKGFSDAFAAILKITGTKLISLFTQIEIGAASLFAKISAGFSQMAAGIGACLPPLILLIAGVTVLTTLWKAWDIGTKIKMLGSIWMATLNNLINYLKNMGDFGLDLAKIIKFLFDALGPLVPQMDETRKAFGWMDQSVQNTDQSLANMGNTAVQTASDSAVLSNSLDGLSSDLDQVTKKSAATEEQLSKLAQAAHKVYYGSGSSTPVYSGSNGLYNFTNSTPGNGYSVTSLSSPSSPSYQVTSLPGRANGGRVTQGNAVIVGENRAEVYVPDRDGTIYPDLSALGGKTEIHFHYSPTISTADQYEVKNKLMPAFEEYLRQREASRG